MGARMSAETHRAMAMVEIDGKTPYAAARAVGLWPSTLYSALKNKANKKIKKREKKT